jgi:NAD-dependent deacetylase
MKNVQIPDDVKRAYKAARNIIILTGAGVSAESGIDTFRGEDGAWSKVNVEEVATPQGFKRDPKKVWEWYDFRRTKLLTCKPNPAHYAIAELEEEFDNFTLVTQNVDGLHQRAGAENVIEIHGNIWEVIDTETQERYIDETAPFPELPPYNKKGHLLRPGVVWFGEMLPEGAMERAVEAASRADICLVVGTSAYVQPAASIPMYAKKAGAMVLEFNLDPSELSGYVDHSFQGKAGETLPRFRELMAE